MATLLVKHRVANFDKWKKVFDRLEGLREKHGFIAHSVHRDATDLALPASLLYLVDRPRICGLCATTSSGVTVRV